MPLPLDAVGRTFTKYCEVLIKAKAKTVGRLDSVKKSVCCVC